MNVSHLANTLQFGATLEYHGKKQGIQQLLKANESALEPAPVYLRVCDDGQLVMLDFPTGDANKLDPLPDVRHVPRRIIEFVKDPQSWVGFRVVMNPLKATYYHRIASVNFAIRRAFGIPIESPLKNLQRAIDYVKSVYKLQGSSQPS